MANRSVHDSIEDTYVVRESTKPCICGGSFRPNRLVGISLVTIVHLQSSGVVNSLHTSLSIILRIQLSE
jgi:hypothetical protein